MQMRIRPTHHGLQGAMQIAERNFPRHQNTPPNRWPGFEKGHFDDVDIHERRAHRKETEEFKQRRTNRSVADIWHPADSNFVAIPSSFPFVLCQDDNPLSD